MIPTEETYKFDYVLAREHIGLALLAAALYYLVAELAIHGLVSIDPRSLMPKKPSWN